VPIKRVHSFLTHPAKHSQSANTNLRGVAVPLHGKLFELLRDLYVTTQSECDMEISFRPGEDGAQNNACRDLILGYIKSHTLSKGLLIAKRLASWTDKRSGLGLLFIIYGQESSRHRIVISRFPTDSAILADEDNDGLTVSFLERVFLKSKHSYKAVIYEGASLSTGFWTGYAIDRQLNNLAGDYPNYWIGDFLDSELAVTPAAGTHRFANAIREAAKRAHSFDIKRELIAAATLATNLQGQRTSINELAQRFGLSNEAAEAIRNELKAPIVADEKFHFDANEFRTIVVYRSVELDNGGTMTALASSFDQVFRQELIPNSDHEVQFSTRGKVVDQRLKRAQ